MSELLKRKDSENFLSYAKRITDNRKELDLDYSEWAKLLIGKDYSSDNGRKAYYVIKPVLEKLEIEKVQDITDKDILNELELQRIELLKERKKKQRVTCEYNKLIAKQSDKEFYIERVQEAILSKEPLVIPELIKITDNKKEGLLCISDQHYGKQVEMYGLSNEVINEYNIKIFEKRMWDLLSQVVHKIKDKKLEKLNVYNLGDAIDGILRMSQLMSLQTGVVDSVIGFSEFMATWLNELSKYAVIEYNECWGNHDAIRLLDNKSHFPKDNVTKIVMEFINLRLKDNPNVTINDLRSPYIYRDILGMKVLGYHGEDKELSKAREHMSKLYNAEIDMVLGGHLHSQSLITDSVGKYGDVQCIRVPSVCGIDDFSNKIRKSARAGAMMFLFEENKGKTETYDFWLN